MIVNGLYIIVRIDSVDYTYSITASGKSAEQCNGMGTPPKENWREWTLADKEIKDLGFRLIGD